MRHRANRRAAVCHWRKTQAIRLQLNPPPGGDEGSRELSANCADLSQANLEHAIANLSTQIQQATDPVLHETLLCDFSTTTPAIRTASEVVLMDTFSSYFTYIMRCLCGIPRITIEGTVNDWQRIRARIEVIETYGLQWWISRLRPILDEFVLAAEGHPTREFWQAIYKPAQAYGTKVVTGWITDLFPYLGDAPRRCRIPSSNTIVTNGPSPSTKVFQPAISSSIPQAARA